MTGGSTGGDSMLVVFSGLPGVGKTTIARRVAQALDCTFLRIDSIETAVARSGIAVGDSPVGYLVAERVAADQLRSGRSVVADAVHSVEIARVGWVELAADYRARLRFVQVVCTDAAEHRRRVEARQADVPGLRVPTWDEVASRSWEPMRPPFLRVDNVGDPQLQVDLVLRRLGEDP